jgi:hypothetical protein
MNPFVKDFVPNFGAQPPPPPRTQPPPPPPAAQPEPVEESWDAEPAPAPTPAPAAAAPPPPAAPAPAPEPKPAPEPEPEPAPVVSAPVVEQVAAAVEKVEIVDDAGADADETKLMEVMKKINEEDPRAHLNIVFIGHVDAGKSTLGGQILFVTVSGSSAAAVPAGRQAGITGMVQQIWQGCSRQHDALGTSASVWLRAGGCLPGHQAANHAGCLPGAAREHPHRVAQEGQLQQRAAITGSACRACAAA